MLEIKAEAGTHGGLFVIVCKKCGVATKNRHHQKDRIVWVFTATCSQCRESREFRLNTPDWEGLP